MSLYKIERLHSTFELVLAITNNWCEKHHEEPQFCGASKEARNLLGDVLKVGGILLCLVAVAKTLSR